MSGDAFEPDAVLGPDSTLARLLRARKWMLLSALTLILLDTGLLDFAGLAATVHMPYATREQVQFAVSITAAYQALILILLFVQLPEVYHYTLRDRTTHQDIANIRQIESNLSNFEGLLESARRKEVGLEANDPALVRVGEEIANLTHQVKSTELSLVRLRRMRWTIFRTEMFMDAVKILPTVGVFTYALFSHAHFWPIPSLMRSEQPDISIVAPTPSSNPAELKTQ